MDGKRGLLTLLILALPLLAMAQDADKEPEGRVWGDYRVHQSVEFGGHIVDTTGSDQMYATYVNLRSGPRLLGQDLMMQSISHEGLLFDNLYLSSFGFGGDPENLARLRLQKNKLYNFVGLYRRDLNVFDYNLFANPLNLNPGSVTCGVGCTNGFTPSALPWFSNSPHVQNTARNMGDFSLTLFPESTISVRLGYARNNTNGRLDTTLETPIRSIITQDSQWRSDRYQGGVDLKLLPRTTISADFFFEHDKTDWNFADSNLLYTLGNGTGPLIDPGILVPPTAGTTSCAGAVVAITGGSFIIDPGCTGLLLNTGPGGAYFKRGNVRTDIPTGQLSFQSNYFRNLDITGSGVYSSASSDFLNFSEFSHGASPTTFTGRPARDRISTSADLGLTYHLSKSWSVSDKFRWYNWREPGSYTETRFICAIPAGALAAPAGFPVGTIVLTPLLNPCDANILFLTGLGTAGNRAAGQNFETLNSYTSFLGERSYYNTFKVNWQPSRRFSSYVGYRYGRRELKTGDQGSGIVNLTTTTITTDGLGGTNAPVTVTTPGAIERDRINQHSGLFGFVIRPYQAWRINADLELLYGDNAFTTITPRHQQRVRAYTNFKLKRWASINGGVHFIETRHDFARSETVEGTSTPLFPATGALVPFYGHKDHWRSYSAGMTLTPNSKFTFDIGWTLLDQDIKSATCVPVAANAFTGITGPSACLNGVTARALLLDYQESTNTLFVNASYSLVKRVKLLVGYDVTGDNGVTNWRRADTGAPLQVVGDIFGNSPGLVGNPIAPCPGASVAAGCVFSGPFPDQPLGPQAITWHKGSAGIAFDITKTVTFKGLWSYYDYNAKDGTPSLAGLTVVSPRDFHANVGTVSLKYSF